MLLDKTIRSLKLMIKLTAIYIIILGIIHACLISMVEADDKCNCVEWVRNNKVSSLPHGLWNIDDKKKIINSHEAEAGSVAILNIYLPIGHVAYVEDIKKESGKKIINIIEANYKKCQVTKRVGTETDLKIIGFWKPSSKHTLPPKSYHIRITNIDDIGECFVNGKQVAKVGYYKDTGWIDITKHLRDGENKIKFKVTNNGGGYTYYFGVKENGHIKWEKKCGEVGRKGCTKDDLPKGKSLTKEYTFKL